MPDQIEKALQQNWDSFLPHECLWEVTSRCNASCEYCYLEKNNTEDLSTNEVLAIADTLCREGMLFVTVSGGEPLLRPNILTILDRLIAGNIFQITLLTNGTLFETGHLDYLSKNRGYFRNVQMTVFSHLSEIHDRYMGVPGSLDRIIANAEILKKNGIPVTLAFPLFPFNVDRIAETNAFYSDIGVELSISIDKLITDVNRASIAPELTSAGFYSTVLKHAWPDLKKSMVNSICRQPDRRASGNSPCAAMGAAVSIDSTGTVFPCALLRHLRLGSLRHGASLQAILSDPANTEYQRIRGIKTEDFSTCSRCVHYGYCALCIGKNFLENRDYFTPASQECNAARAFATPV